MQEIRRPVANPFEMPLGQEPLFGDFAVFFSQKIPARLEKSGHEMPPQFFAELRRTLWFLQDSGISIRQAIKFTDILFQHIPFFANSNGDQISRRTEICRFSGERALAICHPLKTVNLALGLLQNSPSRIAQPDEMRKIALVALLHDTPEDGIASEDWIFWKLGDSEIDVVDALEALNKHNFPNSNGGVDVAKNLDSCRKNWLASIVKLADIFQNGFSPHTDKQREKYTENYAGFVVRHDLFEGADFRDFLSPELVRKIFSNQYLAEVFEAEYRKIGKNYDFRSGVSEAGISIVRSMEEVDRLVREVVGIRRDL